MEKKNRAYYLILLCAIFTSFCLLTVSYSTYSGVNNESFINKERIDNFIITYKTENNISLKEEKSFDFAITNKDTRARSVAIYVLEKNQKPINDVSFSLNNGEEKTLTKDPILIENFSAFGDEEDFKSYRLELKSQKDKDLNFQIKLIEIDKTTNAPVSSVEETN